MKKFLSLMLAVLMLLSMATVAFADGEGDTADGKTPNVGNWNITGIAPNGTFDLRKEYKGGLTAPAESFSFSFDKVSYPQGVDDSLSLPFASYTKNSNPTETDFGKITVTLPNYSKAGTYKYTMRENVPEEKKTGVTYDTDERTMIVYVTNKEAGGLECQIALIKGDHKDDAFYNVYETGKVKIVKSVTSNTGSFFAGENATSHEYKFKFTISGVSEQLTAYHYDKYDGTNTVSGVVDNLNGEFTLKNGEWIEFTDLPVQAECTVYEVYDDPKHTDGNGTYTSNMLENDKVSHTVTTTDATYTCTNEFAYQNDLAITKKVTGTGGNHNATFTVDVTFEGAGLDEMVKHGSYTVNSDKTRTGDNALPNFTPVKNNDGKYVYTFTVTDCETVTIKGLPQNVTYKVEEQVDSDSHNVTYTNQTGILTNQDVAVEIKNDKGIDIETGVSLDTLPYVLVLALAGAGLVMMIARKRRVED